VPEISLQAYGNEIDQLIEQARYLEALAHARHILTQHPRYVGAYYLLGKVLLEVDLPELAADVFRRALSGDPEHLMARIGLGLSHERANNLDASIWNLTRALELDPGNNEISDELRRMYGRRDGLEPDYIKQTPAGLARLYIRGGRNGRAVALLRGLLDAEPARPDLMTSLAEAHWRNGQIVQASDLCQEILDKMPYNCKANLLLGTLWVNSDQEEGWTYLQRAQEVDPENAVAATLFGSESLLEPQATEVERLVYDPDAVAVDQESSWFKRLEAASVSVGLSEAPPEMTESEMRLVDITAGLESQIEIPDWLKELGGSDEDAEPGTLGWMAEAGTEDAAEDAAEEPAEETASAPFDEDDLIIEEAGEEAPDWLQELTAQEMSFDVDEADGAPDWLVELVDEEGDAGEAAQPMVDAFVEESEEETEAEVEAEEATVEDVAWLTDFAADGPAEGEDWLGALQDTVADAGDAEAPGEPTAASDGAAVSEEMPDAIPDWLSALEPTGEAQPAEGEASAELPDWIAGLAPEPTEEAEVAEASEPPAVLEAVTPDDVEVIAETAAEPEPADEAAETEEQEPLPDWMADLVADGEGVSALSGDAAPDWLVDFTPAETETEAQPVSEDVIAESVDQEEPEAPLEAEGLPDWLADLGPEETGAEAPETGVSADWLSELTGSLEATSAVADEELTVFAAPDAQGIVEDEGLTGAEALSWLDDLTAERGGEPSVDAEPETVVAEPVTPEPPPADDETVEMALPVIETVEDIAPPLAEPDAGSAPDELMSGDDALAWLESLADGKEDELRAQVEVESEARVAEIMGRKPVVLEPESVEEAAPVEEPEAVSDTEPGETAVAPEPVEEAAEAVAEILEEAPTVESDLLSGDDALAWLESLADGKEDELRAQAEAESEARVAEILGRKPVAREPEPEPEAAEVADPETVIEEAAVAEAPEPEPVAEIEPESVVEETPEVAETGDVPVTPEPAAETAVEAPSEEGDLLSGDDALLWLQSLTSGKEEELRAQAEAEAEVRVDEILGRRRPEPTVGEEPEPDVAKPATVIAEIPEEAAEVAELEPEQAASEPVEVEEAALEAGSAAEPEEQAPEFFGWSSFGDEPVDVSPQVDEPVPEPVAEAPEVAPEPEPAPDAGEDAMTWLSELSPEKAAELESQLAPEGAAEPAQGEDGYFGWSSFSGQPEEVAAAPEPEPVEFEVVVEPEPEPVAATPVEQVAEAPVAVVEEAVMEAVEAAEPEPEVVEAVVEVVEEIEPGADTAPAETAPAEIDELEEMRAHLKRKRSDHATRLVLARALWQAGEIQESMQHYGRLIKAGSQSDEVMVDLEAYVASGPSSSSVMRTLGDAHMKTGDLEKALEIYNSAMNML